MRRAFLVLPIVLFAILIVVLGILTLQTNNGRDPSLILSPLVGKLTPEFSLPAAAENIPGGFTTSDLNGKATMVNVFSSWCVPCLAEHPLITRLAADGLPVYGINHRDTKTEVSKWLKKNGNPYTAVGFDPDGRVSTEWGVTGIPETFIINADGIVTFKYSGPITPEVLENRILPKLREASQ